MPISRERASEIVARIVGAREPLTIKEELRAVSTEERPLPPRVPAGREWSAAGLAERVEFLAKRNAEIPALTGRLAPPDPDSLRGNIEHYIGMAQVPVGLIGPLRVSGLHIRDDVYVPLATSEGALVASYDRGARLISRAGGAVCLLTQEQVQRAPGFAFETLADAAHFAVWAVDQIEPFRELTKSQTSHGQLIDMMTHVEGNHVYLIFAFHPGDAAGQNMVTFCSAAICRDIIERTPIQPSYWFLESNMSGDKKATAMSFLQTRGRNVTAEVLLPRPLVLEGLPGLHEGDGGGDGSLHRRGARPVLSPDVRPQ